MCRQEQADQRLRQAVEYSRARHATTDDEITPAQVRAAIENAHEADRYRFGSYRIATAPEPNSGRLTSFRSTLVDSPANNVLRRAEFGIFFRDPHC